MPRALIIGGTGLVGRATARRLLASGWQVDVTGRDPARLAADLTAAGARFYPAERTDTQALALALAGGADLIVDCIAYTADDARALLPILSDASGTVMISSKAVYADDHGNHSNSDTPPKFATPISETCQTVPFPVADPHSRAGYGAHKAAAERVFLDSHFPVTVLRPSKIHGEGARRPREWVYVKRVLDHRPVILLAHGGAGTDHPSAAVNIAALIEVVAAHPDTRILNSADPDAPSGRQIARTIARHLGHVWREIVLDDDAPEGLGAHPWDAPHPIRLDMAAAAALGYTPAGDYAATVAAEIDWLTEIAVPSSDGARLPNDLDNAFFRRFIDYEAEERWLAAHQHG